MPDLDAGRLAVASKLGADHTLLVNIRDSKQLARQIVSELGSHPDQTIECSGAPPSVATGIYVSDSVTAFYMLLLVDGTGNKIRRSASIGWTGTS